MGKNLRDILQEARAAQKIWAATSVTRRAQWLKNFQKLLVQKKDLVIEAVIQDTGKPYMEGLGIELTGVLLTANYYRKQAAELLKPRSATPHWIFKNKKAVVERSPYGVVEIIGPSNLPFSLTIGDAIPALMAGNSVIIKPSSLTPKSAQVGASLALEAGLPQNVLQVVEGDGELASKIIEEVDCVFFTGSTAVGKKVAAKAGEFLKPCILELGGKAPLIVLEDADLERAAQACVWGRFAHSGQHCIAIERVYVDEKIAKDFIDRVVALTQKIAADNLSPLKIPSAAQHLKALVDDAASKGAKIIWPTDQKVAATYCTPTILIDVTQEMRVMREESFGPLLPIATFSTLQEAIRQANASSSGLSAYIFSKNKIAAQSIAHDLETGNVAINDCLDQFMIMDAPFGGWKNSGLGVRHGAEGLLQFTHPKTILTHRFPWPFCSKKEFWWFPYRKGNTNLLKALIRIFFG